VVVVVVVVVVVGVTGNGCYEGGGFELEGNRSCTWEFALLTGFTIEAAHVTRNSWREHKQREHRCNQDFHSLGKTRF
jgi:hypothetical protein